MKAGRARICGDWRTVFDPSGLLPAPGWSEPPPLRWVDARVVALNAAEVARLFAGLTPAATTTPAAVKVNRDAFNVFKLKAAGGLERLRRC